MSDKARIQYKYLFAGAGLMVSVAAAGYFGYHKYSERDLQKRIHVACVAVALPYVALERNRSLMTGSISDLKTPAIAEGETAATAPTPQAPPVVLSLELDRRLLEISEKMQKVPDDTSSAAFDALNKDFEDLSSLFFVQAAPYMNDCVGLFNRMAEACGGLGDASAKGADCQAQFKDDFGQLIAKHISSIGAAESSSEGDSRESEEEAN